MKNYALAIDPGLDGVGLAWFDIDRYQGRPPAIVGSIAGPEYRAARCFVDWGDVEIGQELLLPVRLQMLYDLISMAGRKHEPEVVWVEEPQITGGHDHTQKRMAGVAQLHRATGVILAALGGLNVHLVKAGQVPKEMRQRILEQWMKAAQRELPTGPRGGTTGVIADVRDAVYLGWHCMQFRLEADLKQQCAEV